MFCCISFVIDDARAYGVANRDYPTRHGDGTGKVQEFLYLNPADGYGWKHVDKSMP